MIERIRRLLEDQALVVVAAQDARVLLAEIDRLTEKQSKMEIEWRKYRERTG